MEIKAKIEEKTVKGKFVTVTLTPESAVRIKEVLNSLVKRSKPDRYEEFIIKDLVQALEKPEAQDEISGFKSSTFPANDRKREQPSGIPPGAILLEKEEKLSIINKVKAQADPQNKETLATWIKGSVKFAQEQMGITTIPESEDPEVFYDWLVGNKIIDKDGNPMPRR